MESMKKVEPLLERYEGNRVIRGLVQLVPFGIGSAFDVVLVRTLEKMQEDRARSYFDALSEGGPLDDALLGSEGFLHRFFATTRAALDTRREEKIQMFARLLLSSVSDTRPIEPDEYEEFLGILDDLSYREMLALSVLDRFSERKREPDHNDLQWTNTFWDEFEQVLCSELQVPEDSVSDFMNRISRTGCYEMFTGGYLDYTGGKGKLSLHTIDCVIMFRSAQIMPNKRISGQNAR
jgi:hypothetical protein